MDYSTSVDMVTIVCAGCGIVFAITKDFEKRRRKDHKYFFCPNRCVNFYPHESEEEKLRKTLERKGKELVKMEKCCLISREKAEHLEYKFRGMKGAYAKLKKTVNQAVEGEENESVCDN